MSERSHRVPWIRTLAVVTTLALAAGSLTVIPALAGSRAPVQATPSTNQQDCGEEYVWVGALSTLPLFVARDFKVLNSHAADLGVCARVSGPTTFDVPGEVAAIEQECAGKPAGIMVLGLDASLAPAIDKCIEAEVPVVTLDVDVPNSKRLSFVGGDFDALGHYIADSVVANLQRRGVPSGSIAITGALTNPSTVTIMDAIKDVLSQEGSPYTLATIEEDQNTAEGGAATMAAVISGYPDLVASIHLNSEAGIGAAQAVAEAGKQGQISVFAGENDLDFAKKVQSGEIAGFFGPRRELHTYYALQALYDFNHPTIVVDGLDKWTAPPIPTFYDVGAIFVDDTNIESFLSAHPE